MLLFMVPLICVEVCVAVRSRSFETVHPCERDEDTAAVCRVSMAASFLHRQKVHGALNMKKGTKVQERH